MTRGGARPGAGRKPRTATGAATYQAKVWLNVAELAELTGALRPGETIGSLLRDAALRVARRRAK